jgi:hypothetical protein
MLGADFCGGEASGLTATYGCDSVFWRCEGRLASPIRADILFPTDPQGVGYAIDVVEPGRDECDLQDCLVVESGGAQAVVVIFPDFRGVLGKFDHVVQHHAVLFGYGGSRVVLLQRSNQRFVKRYPTQKLCVGLDSIDAPIGDGNHSSDHFVLAAGERQIWRHERAKGRESMVERFGN